MTTGSISTTTPMSDNEDHFMRYSNYHRISSLGWNVSFGDAFHIPLSWIEHAIRMSDKKLIKVIVYGQLSHYVYKWKNKWLWYKEGKRTKEFREAILE